MERLSTNLEPSIKELKAFLEEINKSKEILKREVHNIFTKIRTELNNREDKLLLDIDEKFEKLFFNEGFVKKCEKIPNLVKISLDNGKINEQDWQDENKLNKIINNCIKIENTIKNINTFYDKIKEYNLNRKIKFEVNPKNEELEQELNLIKKIGNIQKINDDFKIKSQK